MGQGPPNADDVTAQSGAVPAKTNDNQNHKHGTDNGSATALSQEATAHNKSHLKTMHAPERQNQPGGLPHVEIVDSSKNETDRQKHNDGRAEVKQEPQKPDLSNDAVKKAAHDLHDAVGNRALHGYGWSSPDLEKLVNILSTLNAHDCKAVEDAYNTTFKPDSLRSDLAKYLGQESPEYFRVEGLLKREDGKPDYASQIRTELATLAQIVEQSRPVSAGYPYEDINGRKNAESDIRKIFAGLDSSHLEELKKTYAHNYPGHDLVKDLMENHNVSQETKEALKILLKGNDHHSDADAVELAKIGLKSQRFDIFQEATENASPAARQALKNAGVDRQIDTAFGGVERSRAHDFLARGGDSLLSLIDGNNHFYHTNRDGITQALTHAGADEKELFAKGEKIAKTVGNDQTKAQHLANDDKNALAFYQKIHQALESAGSEREVGVWEAQLLGQSGEFVSKLASTHDDGWKLVHWFSGHDKNELLAKVEGLSQQDWQHFRAHPEDLDRVDQTLKTYASDAERKEIMNMLKAKVNKDNPNWTYQDSQKVGHRSIDSTFQDTGTNVPAKIDAIMNLSEQERQAYRNNENGFRDHFNQMVKQQIPEGVERDLAVRLLSKIQANKDFDAVDRVMLGVVKNDSSDAIHNIEDAFKQDPSLLNRLKNPQSAEDKAIKSAFDRAARAAVDKGGFGDQRVSDGERGKVTIPGDYDKFIKPLFQSGHEPLELKLRLQSSDKQTQMEEILHADPAEQKRLMAIKPEDMRGTILEDPAQRQMLENAIKQGRPDAADLFRAFTLGANSYCDRLKGLLEKMSPQERQDLANEYYTKYKTLISTDVIAKVPETEKFRFRELLKPTDTDVRQIALDARAESNRHNSVIDDFIAAHWDYSKIQAKNREDDLDKFITSHGNEIDKLPPEQKQQFINAVAQYQSAERDYISSKGKLTEALVDSTITLAAIAGSVFTGGVSLELCAAIGAGGAAYRVAVAKTVEGADFEESPQNYLRHCFKGFTAASLSFVPGGRGIAAVGEKLAPAIVERGLLQAGMHELPQVAKTALERELAQVTRQEAITGGKNLGGRLSHAVEQALGSSASAEEKALLKRSLQNQLKKGVMDDVKSSIPKRLLNALEPAVINAGIGAGGNAATEILATAVGLEDPNTLWERVKGSAVAGAGGALVFHFGFKTLGATYSGLKGIIGKDSHGLFAGEGTTIRHEDGTTTSVERGEQYRFRKGDQIAEMERAGSDNFKPNEPYRVKVGGQQIEVRPGHEEMVGRYHQNNLPDNVSRDHAALGADAHGPYIVDHSAGGTYVTRDGKTYKLVKDQRFYLKPHDQVGLGRPLSDGGERLEVSQPEGQRQPGRENLDFQRTAELPPAKGPISPYALQQSNDYSYYHEISEPIRDGFHNAGEDAGFDADGRFWNQSNGSADRPATVVDVANDPVLRRVIEDAKARFGDLPPKQRAEALAKYAKQLMTPEGMSSRRLDQWYDEFNLQHEGQRILLGEFIRQGKGVCSQQALLLKVLADQFPDLHATMVRGNYGGGSSLNHAWTTFDFGDGQKLVYDPRQQIFGKPYSQVRTHTPGGDARGHHKPAAMAMPPNQDAQRLVPQDKQQGLKLNDKVEYNGQSGWRVAGFQGDNVVILAGGGKTASKDDVQALNPGLQLVPGHAYKLRRSNGTIDEGWILHGFDQDGNLVFEKNDALREVVPRKALKPVDRNR